MDYHPLSQNGLNRRGRGGTFSWRAARLLFKLFFLLNYVLGNNVITYYSSSSCTAVVLYSSTFCIGVPLERLCLTPLWQNKNSIANQKSARTSGEPPAPGTVKHKARTGRETKNMPQFLKSAVVKQELRAIYTPGSLRSNLARKRYIFISCSYSL